MNKFEVQASTWNISAPRAAVLTHLYLGPSRQQQRLCAKNSVAILSNALKRDQYECRGVEENLVNGKSASRQYVEET